MAAKSVTALLFSGRGKFDEVVVERGVDEDWHDPIRRILGVSGITEVGRHLKAFTSPFRIFVDEAGQYNGQPTALVVEPMARSGINAFFGQARCSEPPGGGSVL